MVAIRGDIQVGSRETDMRLVMSIVVFSAAMVAGAGWFSMALFRIAEYQAAEDEAKYRPLAALRGLGFGIAMGAVGGAVCAAGLLLAVHGVPSWVFVATMVVTSFCLAKAITSSAIVGCWRLWIGDWILGFSPAAILTAYALAMLTD
jgi:hypothetical protein